MRRRFRGFDGRVLMLGILIAGLVFLSVEHSLRAADSVPLGFRTQSQWETWQPVTFSGRKETTYRYEPSERAVCARSDDSASGMAREISVSLSEYPVLSWEWKVEGPVPGGDATRKESDDYAARVYVNFERDGSLSWWQELKARTFESFYGHMVPGSCLTFIWANRLQQGQHVPSPYTPLAQLIALRSGSDRTGQWVQERVHLLEWHRRAFGKEAPPVQSVAIMTDSDNTHSQASACYRNIRLRSEEASMESAP